MMRILPDMNFRENYKKRYAENYDKINAKLAERGQRAPVRPTKYGVVGFISSIVIIGSFFVIGNAMAVKFAEKEQKIAELQAEIANTENLIKNYQIVNGEAMSDQINEAVTIITDLQNAYLTNDFFDNFKAYEDRYLGGSNNWASDLNLSEPVWSGYFDKASTTSERASFIFILYDNRMPVLVVNAVYYLDDNGNLGTIRDVRRMRLV